MMVGEVTGTKTQDLRAINCNSIARMLNMEDTRLLSWGESSSGRVDSQCRVGTVRV